MAKKYIWETNFYLPYTSVNQNGKKINATKIKMKTKEIKQFTLSEKESTMENDKIIYIHVHIHMKDHIFACSMA